MPVMSLSELNQRNREFWREQHMLLESRMRDPSLRSAAFRMLNSEHRRSVPVRSQLSLYEAFEEAHLMGVGASTTQARKGGRAKKTDALQRLILRIVEQDPKIAAPQLEKQLEAQQGLGVIDDFDDETITFCRPDGRLKDAKRSGLKDRLSRAKKENRSR
jgi:hypothetical protein